MGKFEMAIADFEQSLLRDSTFADTYWALGLTYDAIEDFDKALEYYQQYLDLAGEDASQTVIERVQALQETEHEPKRR